MEIQTDGPCWCLSTDKLASSHALGSCDIKLAGNGVWWRKFAADPELLLEPLHGLGTLECPDDMNISSHCLSISHLLNKRQQLRYNSGDTASTGDENNVVKGFDTSLHTAVWAVEKRSICMPRSDFEGLLVNLVGESTKRTEHNDHIPVSFTILGREIIATQGGNSKWVVLEDRNAGHSKVHVLTGSPSHLSRDRDFDGVLWHDRHGSFVANEPGELKRVGPVEVEESHQVGAKPDAKGSKQVVPRCKIVMAVPEHHANKEHSDRDMKSHKQLIHLRADWWEGVNTEESERNKSGDSYIGLVKSQLLQLQKTYQCRKRRIPPWRRRIRKHALHLSPTLE